MKVRFIALTLFLVLLVGAIVVWMAMANSLVEVRPENYLPATVKIFAVYLQFIFVYYRIQTRTLARQAISRALVAA